jgi:hypothetical protein
MAMIVFNMDLAHRAMPEQNGAFGGWTFRRIKRNQGIDIGI